MPSQVTFLRDFMQGFGAELALLEECSAKLKDGSLNKERRNMIAARALLLDKLFVLCSCYTVLLLFC